MKAVKLEGLLLLLSTYGSAYKDIRMLKLIKVGALNNTMQLKETGFRFFYR